MQTAADTPHPEKDKKDLKKAHARHTPHVALPAITNNLSQILKNLLTNTLIERIL